MFAHHMVWKYVHTLYHTVLFHVTCGSHEVLVVVVDAWSDYMPNPYWLADALQVFHHLMWMGAMVCCEAFMKFLVHCLHVKQNKVGNFQKAFYGIVKYNSASVQSRVYALFLAQTEVFFHKGSLDKWFSAGTGNTACLDEIAILQCFFQQLLGSPFIFDRSLQIPGVGIVAEETTHGTTLYEGKETYARSVDRAKRFQ